MILDGLSRLEYRGYDSAGIVVFDGKEINYKKSTGRLKALENLTRGGQDMPGLCGIGHTRWATRGVPSNENAYLLDYYDKGDPMEAIFRMLRRVEGSYALGILFAEHPDTIRPRIQNGAIRIEELDMSDEELAAVKKILRSHSTCFWIGIFRTIHTVEYRVS